MNRRRVASFNEATRAATSSATVAGPSPVAARLTALFRRARRILG